MTDPNSLWTILLPIFSTIVGSGAFIAIFTDRRKRAAEARKMVSEGGKADAEGQVTISGQSLEWARDFRQEAKDARDRARAAEIEAREANVRADQCARDRDDDRERIEELEKAVAALTARLSQYEAV